MSKIGDGKTWWLCMGGYSIWYFSRYWVDIYASLEDNLCCKVLAGGGGFKLSIGVFIFTEYLSHSHNNILSEVVAS